MGLVQGLVLALREMGMVMEVWPGVALELMLQEELLEQVQEVLRFAGSRAEVWGGCC